VERHNQEGETEVLRDRHWHRQRQRRGSPKGPEQREIDERGAGDERRKGELDKAILLREQQGEKESAQAWDTYMKGRMTKVIKMADTPMIPIYQSHIGMLMWIVQPGRFVVGYAVSTLSGFNSGPQRGHQVAVDRVLGYYTNFNMYPTKPITPSPPETFIFCKKRPTSSDPELSAGNSARAVACLSTSVPSALLTA